jgi:hypothetical protein
MRKPRTWAALVMLAAAAAITSCSAHMSGPQVASLPGHAGSAGHQASTLTENQSDQDMVSFTRCMRQHGVTMSDPVHVAGHAGLRINLPTRDAATHTAYSACDHFMGPIYQQKQADMAARTAAILPALTRYAACMRSHDINMLDPKSDGSLSLGTLPGITSDFGRKSPQFHTADSACRHLLPRSVHDDGTGP